MSTKDYLELLTSKKQNNILDFAYLKKNYCNYLPKETDWKIKPPQNQFHSQFKHIWD